MRTPLLVCLLVPVFLTGAANAAVEEGPPPDRREAGAAATIRLAQIGDAAPAHRGGYRDRYRYDDRYRYRDHPSYRWSGRDRGTFSRPPPRRAYNPPPRRAYSPPPYHPRRDPYCGPFARYGGIYCESGPN